MSELELGGLILVVTLVVLLSGLPIAFGLTAVAVGFLYAFAGPGSLNAVASLATNASSNSCGPAGKNVK